VPLHARSHDFVRPRYLVLLGLLAAGCSLAPIPSTASAQTAAPRDPQALTILTQVISAGGGPAALTAVQDFTETGTVNYPSDGGDTGSVTVKGRGLSQFRMDAAISEGQRSILVNGNSSLLTDPTGGILPIPSQSAADLGGMMVPYLPLISAITDSSVSIVYAGPVVVNGATDYDIRFQRVYTAQQDATGTLGAREARDVYIDSNTYLITGIADQIYYGSGSGQSIAHEILYSNYQPEGGIAMPLTVSETVNGTTGFTMQLSQISFNSGLTDSDFQ